MAPIKKNYAAQYKEQAQLITITVRTYQTNVVKSKGWLSDGGMDALHRNHKTRSMF